MSTTLPSGWSVVGEVSAEQSSRHLFAADAAIYRIITSKGHMCAPHWPGMGTPGLLIRRDAVADIRRSHHVRAEPLSEQR